MLTAFYDSEYVYSQQTATGAFSVKYQKYHQKKLAVLFWKIVFMVQKIFSLRTESSSARTENINNSSKFSDCS